MRTEKGEPIRRNVPGPAEDQLNRRTSIKQAQKSPVPKSVINTVETTSVFLTFSPYGNFAMQSTYDTNQTYHINLESKTILFDV